MGPAKVIDVEVVSESAGPGPSGQRPAASAVGGPPVHSLAALLLLVVDNLWTVPEFLVIDWAITIPLCFLSVTVPVFLIQRHLKKDGVRRAVGLALLLGIVAAVPTSVTGTPVGLAILAWTGIHRLLGRPQPGRPQTY
jgi:hypothetical protein